MCPVGRTRDPALVAQSSAAVEVVGLKALARDVKRLGTAPDLLVQMREAARQAAEPVAAAIRSALPRSNTDHAGRLAGSVRTTATRTGAAVRMGTAAVDYAGPVEFGGWPVGREYVADGRYMYPTARESNMATTAATNYSAAIQRAVNGYNWTNTTKEGDAVHD